MSGPRVDIVVPVLNEVGQLERGIGTLVAFLHGTFRYDWRVIIVDNGSTDGTGRIGRHLAGRLSKVSYLWLDERGRGRALQSAWSASDADIYSYMDVDLSTNLEKFPTLIDAIVRRGYDLAVGSRLMAGAQVKRSLKREVISRSYNSLVKTCFKNQFSDGQCGFKAIRAEVARALLPRIVNQHWFFDTELLLLAEHFGCSIEEVPVVWVEDLDTRVNLLGAAWEDVCGLLRMRFTRHAPLGRVPRHTMALETADAKMVGPTHPA